MPKTKFRKIEQQKTFTRRGQYENALTRTRAKNRPKELSYVEIDIGDGERANVYFTPLPASILKLREAGLDPVEGLKLIVEILAGCVVEPESGEPLMSIDEWQAEDLDFINKVTSAVMGIQFVAENEVDNVPEGELIEIETGADDGDIDTDLDTSASDPNPLDETPGYDSPTTSTESLESADHQNAGEEETSKNG